MRFADLYNISKNIFKNVDITFLF